MPELHSEALLTTASLVIRDVCCNGSHRRAHGEEATEATHLVFPYRGAYVREVGSDLTVADSSQLLFFNAGEGYRVSHPVAGGDASLDIVVSPSLLRELAPTTLARSEGNGVAFRRQRVRIDPRSQVLVALLRHSLRSGIIEPLEAEGLALTLIRRSLGPRTHRPSTPFGRQRLVSRIKLLLAGDLARRWTLADIAERTGYSPIYLTQVFQQVEGEPLYRYQRRLRLARALDLLPRCEDLTALALDLGFSSHSHFTTAFRQVYGRSPSHFRRAVLPPRLAARTLVS